MGVLFTVISIYEIVLIVRVLMSWIRPDPSHPLVLWVERVTEPVLAPVRSLLPTTSLRLDLSPLVVLLLLHFLKNMLLRSGMGVY